MKGKHNYSNWDTFESEKECQRFQDNRHKRDDAIQIGIYSLPRYGRCPVKYSLALSLWAGRLTERK